MTASRLWAARPVRPTMATAYGDAPHATKGATASWRAALNLTVLVAALGYFVDVYDLLLFSIVRVPSLTSMGYSGDALLSVGVLLLNAQMLGLLVGGVMWGVLGDKRGRLSVLFGSIALYSLANIANAFVTDVTLYAVLRFVAGVGLAGELGAAVTLVSEIMTKETRGYGTALIAGFGLFGAVVAALVGGLLDWRIAFIVGGVMGLALLVLRIGLAESGMFRAASQRSVERGSLRLLLSDSARRWRYAHCILLGMPIWFAIGILVTFAPEFGAALDGDGIWLAGMAVLWAYAGGAIGDVASGFVSQRIGSRQWVMLAFIGIIAGAMFLILFSRGLAPGAFYALCFVLGFGVGYWAVFVTNAAEQFGTNLRATVTTTVPNLVRGSVVLLTLGLSALRPSVGLVRAALIVGTACLLVALWSLRSLAETHGRDLDFVET